VLEDLDGPVVEVRLVVLDSPLLAEGLNELVALGEIVAGHHWEEVVVDLVLEPSAKPVDEELGEPVSSDDVAGGGDLCDGARSEATSGTFVSYAGRRYNAMLSLRSSSDLTWSFQKSGRVSAS